jgi:hypothetical protein
MIQVSPKLRTAAACKVARLDRDRFNEAVAGGYLNCVPGTVAGRARVFTPDDMLVLWYFRELVEDGLTREYAGRIACEVADAAKRNPDAVAISYVEDYFGPRSGRAFPADMVPDSSQWDTTKFSGTDIRKVTTFRVGKTREMISHYTAEELSVFGSED